MNGLLLVDKPKGLTSHDVVNFIRRITKTKKVGHTGTLDPNASGLLIICIGEATKLIPYIKDDRKVYRGTIAFGKKTTTDDVEGEILAQKPVDSLTLENLQNVLSDFTGKQNQIPPVYSAKKVNGKKLYDYARKNQPVEIKPSEVIVNKIELLDVSDFPNSIEVLVDCSKGTYIRALARDIGEALGNYACLKELRRLETNTYLLENSLKLEKLATNDDIKKNLLSMEEAVSFLKTLAVNPDSEKFLTNGNRLYQENFSDDLSTVELGESAGLILKDKLKGIGIKKDKDGIPYVQPKKLFNTED